MSAGKSERALLRHELERVWCMVSVIMGAWGEQAAVFVEEIRRLSVEIADIKKHCEKLDAQIRDLKRRLAIHENYNNPDGRTLTAQNRKKHRREVADREIAKSAEDEDVSDDNGSTKKPGRKKRVRRKRGGQPGAEGKSFTLRPDKKLEEWHAPEMCARCGRTDIIHLTPIWKVMLEKYKCGNLFCYMEVSVPALCLQCAVITHPDTPSIPGTSCGPRLRKTIMNMHEVMRLIRKIRRLLITEHNSELGEGTVSKCLSAISRHATDGSLWEWASRELVVSAGAAMTLADAVVQVEEEEEEEEENDEIAKAISPVCEIDAAVKMPKPGSKTAAAASSSSKPPRRLAKVAWTEGATDVMEAHSEPPVGPSAYMAAIPLPKLSSENSPLPETLPVPYLAPDLRAQMANPSLISQITERASMAPYVIEDESEVNVAGRRVRALLALCPGIAAFVRITENKKKTTMRYEFQMLLCRPLLADMYCAGNAFEDDEQTCILHLWRKSESLAVIHGIDSPEQTYSEMMLSIYQDARDTAAHITDMAGGPLTSICENAGAMRAVPGLEEMASREADKMRGRVLKMIHTYRYGEVSDEESRKYATSLENALSRMFTFFWHPGMPGHTNWCETLVKQAVVIPRRSQIVLPDWAAAKNQATLQTLHANAAIWGIYPGQIVSGNRGSWKPPPTQTDMPLMSPPQQRPRPRITSSRITKGADPAIQSTGTYKKQNVKVAAA